MRRLLLAVLLAYACLPAGLWALRWGRPERLTLLNVSYDPTRALWADLNRAFRASRGESEPPLTIRQSHGASGSQARAVIDGLDADVVTLALWSDTDQVRRRGLIAPDWEERLPNRSLPYTSTIVFVVRAGNPKGVRDWPDLVRTGAAIITPNPKTSGNGRMSFLAAWGAIQHRGGSTDEARAFVRQLYQQTPVLETGARNAAVTFTSKHIGDVMLAWENEAILEVNASGGRLEIVYPSCSLRAEPPVAVVDANVDRKGTRVAAEAYLNFLYTPEAQEIIATHYYRPIDRTTLARHADTFPVEPRFELFGVETVAANWEEAQRRFFAAGGVFDQIR